MKSICIKTNNANYLSYLLNELNCCNLESLCFSENHFKNYKNIIIHYTGNNYFDFFSTISCLLSLLVIDEIEKTLFNNILIQSYFYFDLKERKSIIDLCDNIMSEDFSNSFNTKYNFLYNAFYNYISTNHNLVLDGFINFRLGEYISFLDDVIDEAVNVFVVEQEYLEFISLLKIYISSMQSGIDCVHLIYENNSPILFDENKKEINILDNLNKQKYLSDISFSTNDYVLNTLLNLLPQKIYIQLLDDNYPTDFITTLTLIFEDRISVCIEENQGKTN